MSEAGSSPVKRALQSFGSAVGSAVHQHCSSNSDKKGEAKQGGNQWRAQGEQGGERKRSRSKCSCKARCTCNHQVSEGKIEPQLILLQILG